MNVPDELRTLYDDTAEKAIADGVGLVEVDDVALAAVLDRHEQMVRAKVAEDLRRAAKGRRHYAESWSGPERDHLESEAQAFDSAARVAEGDRHTMCALLPVIMWTDAENEIARGES